MSNLFTTLRNSVTALQVFERGTGFVSNNVANAGTPGFAKQRMAVAAKPFDPSVGLTGGVSYVGSLDSRDRVTERIVQQRLGESAQHEARAQHLARLEPFFSIAGDAGIDAALNGLFQSFSALAVAPNDGAARQVVLDRAGQLAVTFRRAAGGVDAAIQSADLSLRQAVGRIEALGRQLAEINTAFRSNFTARNDPALTARLFSTLDQLAELVEFTALEQPDGTVGIYLGGQSLFLLGENLYPIQLDTADVQARIFDFAGRDITTQFQGGSLGGVLELRNSTFAGYRDRLDRLAISVADTVNAQLAGGLDQAGQPPVQALFSYVGAAGAARTLTANPLATSELAAASQQAPGGNANALALAALGGQQLLDGLTLGGYYAALAASVGRGLASARESQITAENLTNQARSLRDELIRVDLNDEAALLLEFQRSYQAASKIVTTIDEMTRTVIDLLR